ncbi:hypothetical protein [Pseudonocardia thermophila]|uniref:hypothetical protein n=1 Tax=Pseudonocardia thermophila TaxID=1848 RepID=UPI00248DA8CA|nr:hypothetical protein [Pseudonocardia thermophila]
MRRLIFTPRWILWHLLTLGAMVTCGFLAAWQWGRAGSAMGSALNVGYGLQWPLFAVFFGVMWWRFLRMEAARLAEGEAGTESSTDGSSTDGSSTDAEKPTEGEPAAVAPAAQTTAQNTARPTVPAAPRPLPDGPSPFGPRPATAVVPELDEDDPDDRRLAAYNQGLAEIAARLAAREGE